MVAQLSLPVVPVAAHVLACNSAKIQSFPRRYRLARREGFSRILKKRAQTDQWFAVHWELGTANHARLGVSVGKRVVPTAVGRNRIKRLIREKFRLVARNGLARDIVVRLRRLPSEAEQSTARNSLGSMFKNILEVAE
ncbi:MAG TPA: ribonuclease P protein component [Sideroxyarcus sp.]|nr:ribonuclease P protein component [Sideroxyarcus sp.]